jgi:prepilin-type processing-associated H-X9-DG protein
VQDYDETYPLLMADAQIDSSYYWPYSITGLLESYTKNHKIYSCPSATIKGDLWGGGDLPAMSDVRSNILANGAIFRYGAPWYKLPPVSVAQIASPASIIMFSETLSNNAATSVRPYTEPKASMPGGVQLIPTFPEHSKIHSDGCNLIFADGHAKWRNVSSITTGEFGMAPNEPWTNQYCNYGDDRYYPNLGQ